MNTNVLFYRCAGPYLVCGFFAFSVLGASETFGYQLPDSGQTDCYDDAGTVIQCPDPGEPFYGQDAQYQRVQPNYADNADGTVTDLNTGLMWQQGEYLGNRGLGASWYDAQSYCSSLNLASHTDWRVPSRRELVSIVDYGRHDPAINTNYFPSTSSIFFYSNDIANVTSPWGVDFERGLVALPELFGPTRGVRCVRGGELPSGDFSDNGDGTVTDLVTELTWQRDAVPVANWQSALAYCEGVTLGGHNDWRLPDVRALESIFVDNFPYCGLDTAFLALTPCVKSWSSTTSVERPDYAFRMTSDNGIVTSSAKYGPLSTYARCVRGGTVRGVCDVGLDYRGGILSLDFTLGTLDPVVWNTWIFLVDYGSALPLVSVSLPVINPPIHFPVNFPFPALGEVYVLNWLATARGTVCFDWETVDTDPAPAGTSPSLEELQGRFESRTLP